ncbi:hypothetical protein P154DRAFT_35335 [Amniculicola lignicola CBS 123094]|uniref:Uncharacterized protein n=1 Tax=Amniculicola lignicola CBS 123094 TaxID=1392246 RepID=A0A6A5WRY5_9PLEO|nr:hypothetical protein P154DRAFT_35335 [Amniculicola lignicola CBS 123094]
MAAPVQLTEQQLDALFLPVLGAYVMSQATKYGRAKDTSIQIISRSTIEYSTDLIAFERDKIATALRINAITSLATTCFGFVFESYKKLVPRTTEEIGRAFGLANVTEADFRQQFPGITVNDWHPSGNLEYWFSAMLRNAFAHAQWEITPDNEIHLWNMRGAVRTFDIVISVERLLLVVIVALYSFIRYVQPDGAAWAPNRQREEPPSYETLYHLLNLEIIAATNLSVGANPGVESRTFLGVDVLAMNNVDHAEGMGLLERMNPLS